MEETRILVVDDEQEIADLLELYLIFDEEEEREMFDIRIVEE